MGERKHITLIPKDWQAPLIETRHRLGIGCLNVGLVAVGLILAVTLCGPIALQYPDILKEIFTPPNLTNDLNPISP